MDLDVDTDMEAEMDAGLYFGPKTMFDPPPPTMSLSVLMLRLIFNNRTIYEKPCIPSYF
jgi:hypothetical protein